jgi:hypothetical protein
MVISGEVPFDLGMDGPNIRDVEANQQHEGKDQMVPGRIP